MTGKATNQSGFVCFWIASKIALMGMSPLRRQYLRVKQRYRAAIVQDINRIDFTIIVLSGFSYFVV